MPIIIAGGLILIYDFLLSRPRGLSSTTMPRPLLVPCVASGPYSEGVTGVDPTTQKSLKRAPECIKMHHFEGENAKIFLGGAVFWGGGTAPFSPDPTPSRPSAPPFECLLHSTPRPHFWIRACVAWKDVMAMGHGSWVMWVMGQLCDGSHGSWVTKDDPFPSLVPWCNFWATTQSKMAENRNSATVWDIVTNFGKVVDMDSPQRAVTPFWPVSKIQDGGRPPIWKKENRHNSAAISDIFTKFGVLVVMDSPQRSLMSFLGYNKIQDGGRPPFLKNGKSQ